VKVFWVGTGWVIIIIFGCLLVIAAMDDIEKSVGSHRDIRNLEFELLQLEVDNARKQNLILEQQLKEFQ